MKEGTGDEGRMNAGEAWKEQDTSCVLDLINKAFVSVGGEATVRYELKMKLDQAMVESMKAGFMCGYANINIAADRERIIFDQARKDFEAAIVGHDKQPFKDTMYNLITRYGRPTDKGGYSAEFLAREAEIYWMCITKLFRDEFQELKKSLEAKYGKQEEEE